MSRLAVMAHYDPDGGIAPHTRRHVEALQRAFDVVVVVSTADLGCAEEEWFSQRVTLVRRDNYGYDFLSYSTGLAAAGDLSGFDVVVVCNDSYVGPLRPYDEILATMAGREVDFWGLTASRRVQPHVQSFFVCFRPWVVASRAFGEFWARMTPLSDRRQVILRYEVGMSRVLTDAGFRWGSYFVETDHERALARRRVQWWATRRVELKPSLEIAREVRRKAAEPWNPAAALADACLDDGRLPYVKIDTLRYDPYGLGADRLLSACERRFPDHFEGVREWLELTAHHYPPRPQEVLHPTPPLARPFARAVRYA